MLLTNIIIPQIGLPDGMSHATTVVGPDDEKLVVSEGENWIESELLIASDTWVKLENMR